MSRSRAGCAAASGVGYASESVLVSVLGLVLGLGLPACTGGAPEVMGFDPSMLPTTDPLMVLPTMAGTREVSVWTAPEPPRKGANELLYRIADLTGASLDGLSLQVVPWMPAHGHGTAAAPVVTPLGEGRYLVKPAYLYMAGRWELRTTIDGSDSVVPVFDVP
jgi:hypothetical protein